MGFTPRRGARPPLPDAVLARFVRRSAGARCRTFDGFYAFLAEDRGAARVVAVDNEQYVAWVKARWGIELEGGEGFRAIAELLGSRVE
jgi:hypothetical protein